MGETAEARGSSRRPAWDLVREARVTSRIDEVIEADIDGDRVLLSPLDFQYFGLEGSGPAVWDMIDGSLTVAQIADALVSRFDAERSDVLRETWEFLEALSRAGLIEIVRD